MVSSPSPDPRPDPLVVMSVLLTTTVPVKTPAVAEEATLLPMVIVLVAPSPKSIPCRMPSEDVATPLVVTSNVVGQVPDFVSVTLVVPNVEPLMARMLAVVEEVPSAAGEPP